MNFLSSLRVYYRSKNFLFVHGGIPTGCKNPEEASTENLVWSYGPRAGYTGPKVICAHVPDREVRESKKSICIDTWCCFEMYGHLTAVVLDDPAGKSIEFIQVKNPIFK